MTFLSGKVLDVIKKGKEVKSADASVLALIEAFDKGIVLAIVEPNLMEEVAKDQTVILRRESPNPQTALFIVTKIVSGNMAKTVNEAFARQLKNMQAQQKHIAEQRAEMSGMIG
jgi:hypothetical protein